MRTTLAEIHTPAIFPCMNVYTHQDVCIKINKIPPITDNMHMIMSLSLLAELIRIAENMIANTANISGKNSIMFINVIMNIFNVLECSRPERLHLNSLKGRLMIPDR